MQITITDDDDLSAPTGLTATAGNAQVTLNWSDPSNSSLTNIPSSDTTTTSHTVTGLTNGTGYSFQVRAVTGTNTLGPASNEVRFITSATPAATVQFSQSAYSVTEGDSVSVGMQLSAAAAHPVDVYIQTIDDTAAAGDDYTAGADTAPDGATGLYRVTVPAGDTSASVSISMSRTPHWGRQNPSGGELSLKSDGDAVEYEPGANLSMAAVGMDGLLLDGGGEGLSLTITADLLMGKTTSAAVAGLESAEGAVTRRRLGLEASRPAPLADGASLLPAMEIGIRQDSGDGETGFGLEMGAGLD